MKEQELTKKLVCDTLATLRSGMQLAPVSGKGGAYEIAQSTPFEEEPTSQDFERVNLNFSEEQETPQRFDQKSSN